MARNILFEMEVEVTRLYTVPIYAENLGEAAAKCTTHWTAVEIEENGDSQDHDVNVVGISRQKGRKMYQ